MAWSVAIVAAGEPVVSWSFDGEKAAGVHGAGLRLSGRHQRRVEIGRKLQGVEQLTISAWVRPEKFDRYNEILRQECRERVLFSFQEHGTILSLGLNVGGYVECDAKIDPKALLDGRWHHAAATFDGKSMRVWLDGREIEKLERAGVPRFNPRAVAFIGSTAGSSEFFQGGMDELQVIGRALTEEEIVGLHERGREVVQGREERLEKVAASVYQKEKAFAETLASVLGKDPEPEIVPRLEQWLRRDFPEEHQRFVSVAGHGALDAPLSEVVEKQLAMVTEYRPITAEQVARQTEDERKHWQAIRPLIERCEAWLGREEKGPEGVELVVELAEHVVERPEVHERVAPYVVPVTLPVVQRTVEEARELIEVDWLFQAGGRVTLERIREEIGWTRELAERVGIDAGSRLDALAVRLGGAVPEGEVEALYFEVRGLKREVMIANPLVDFDELLLVDMPFPQGSEWRHETRHRLGYMAVPGGRLMVLSGWKKGGRLRKLMPREPLHGSFWRPDLSWDGKRVMFCFKPHNEKSFHLYEIGVDGSELRQLTDGPYDDLDPIYLPDGGHILFSTTRGHTYVRCMPPTNAYVLARCDLDGEDLYIVSRNNEPDYLPSVLNDGRIVYTRWEYTDKPLWRAQGLWTMHPDGTQVNTLWGNQSVWPDLVKDARAIPGSTRVLCTGSAHHNWFAGSLAIIEPGAGTNFPNGITKVTADLAWPESGNGPSDPVESERYHGSGNFSAYYSPYPLGEEWFIVSAERGGKFALYLMDVHGNRELIHEGAHNIFHAMPLRPRARPPVIADKVAWPLAEEEPEDGVLFSANVYEGMPAEVRGKAAMLRVMAIQPKTYTHWFKRPYISTGPVVSGVQSDGVKEVLGTVPVRKDGSVAFRVPAGKALHFQLLDEEHRALQTMRSFTGVMPGEVRGCTGCHEQSGSTPEFAMPNAARMGEIAVITPPPWEDRTVSWARYVRPVLDRYCVECHRDDEEARKSVDLTEKPGKLGFDENYWLFTGRPSWGKEYRVPEEKPAGFGIAGMLMVEGYGQRDPEGYKTSAPMTALSYRSRLVELAGGGEHYEVEVDPVNLRRLKVWVDAMAPYRGEEEIREMPDPEFQGVEWLSVRPRIRTAPVVRRPGPVE